MSSFMLTVIHQQDQQCYITCLCYTMEGISGTSCAVQTHYIWLVRALKANSKQLTISCST